MGAGGCPWAMHGAPSSIFGLKMIRENMQPEETKTVEKVPYWDDKEWHYIFFLDTGIYYLFILFFFVSE